MKPPLIGIFWIKDDGKLILDTCPYDQGEDLIGDWLNHSGHYPFWEKYSAKHGIKHEYIYYPRGRVVYNKKNKIFKVMSSKKVIKNTKLVKKIAKAFKISKYKLSADHHYEKAYPLLEE